MLVYETFHATLAKEFPKASFFVYVDGIAAVTRNTNDMQRVLARVQELSLILGFQTNLGKTEVYKWAGTPRARQKRQAPQYDVLRWNGKDILVQPPIFTTFIPHDRMFQHMDKICLEFVAIAKRLEHNKENIYKAHNVTQINSPVKNGGLGLRQIYRAYRSRYVTLVQGLPRKPTRRGDCPNWLHNP